MISPLGPTAHASNGGAKVSALRFVSTSTIHLSRGSVSAVYWCRMADGRRAVLKVSPDRARLAFEAAALGGDGFLLQTLRVIIFGEGAR